MCYEENMMCTSHLLNKCQKMYLSGNRRIVSLQPICPRLFHPCSAVGCQVAARQGGPGQYAAIDSCPYPRPDHFGLLLFVAQQQRLHGDQSFTYAGLAMHSEPVAGDADLYTGDVKIRPLQAVDEVTPVDEPAALVTLGEQALRLA